MVEHQRSILATLGIDLWMPKTDVSTRTMTYSLYRDQAETENVLGLADISSSDTIGLQTQSNNVAEDSSIHVKQEVPLFLKKVETKTVEYLESNLAQNAISTIDPHVIDVAAFTLQACVSEKYTLLVNATELTADEVQLWRSIQMAASGQYYELKWPFALQHFQDGRGAPLYIQGFLDSISSEKPIIAIGNIHKQIELGEIQKCNLICIASLQEMLAQPMLKRILWQKMSSL